MEFQKVLKIAVIVSIIIGILSIVASSIMLAKGQKDFMEKHVDVCEQAEIPMTPEEQKIGARYRGAHPSLKGPLPGPKYAQEKTYGAITCPGVFDGDGDDSLPISIRKATCTCRKIRKASCSLLLVSGIALILGGILTLIFTFFMKTMSSKIKTILLIVFLGLSLVFSIIAFAMGISAGIHIDPIEFDYEIYNEETNPEGKFFVAWAMTSALFDLVAIILIFLFYRRLGKTETTNNKQNKSSGSKTGSSQVSPAATEETAKNPLGGKDFNIDAESQGKTSQASSSSSRQRQFSSRKSRRVGQTPTQSKTSARSGASFSSAGISKSKPAPNTTGSKRK